MIKVLVLEPVADASWNGEFARDMPLPLMDYSEVAFMAKFSGE
ncbi:MAG TPA: hypothetical protein VEP71_00875 [Gallionella sp.]|nr:hypothetical protein [Gallionella sp.]